MVQQPHRRAEPSTVRHIINEFAERQAAPPNPAGGGFNIAGTGSRRSIDEHRPEVHRQSSQQHAAPRQLQGELAAPRGRALLTSTPDWEQEREEALRRNAEWEKQRNDRRQQQQQREAELSREQSRGVTSGTSANGRGSVIAGRASQQQTPAEPRKTAESKGPTATTTEAKRVSESAPAEGRRAVKQVPAAVHPERLERMKPKEAPPAPQQQQQKPVSIMDRLGGKVEESQKKQNRAAAKRGGAKADETGDTAVEKHDNTVAEGSGRVGNAGASEKNGSQKSQRLKEGTTRVTDEAGRQSAAAVAVAGGKGKSRVLEEGTRFRGRKDNDAEVAMDRDERSEDLRERITAQRQQHAAPPSERQTRSDEPTRGYEREEDRRSVASSRSRQSSSRPSSRRSSSASSRSSHARGSSHSPGSRSPSIARSRSRSQSRSPARSYRSRSRSASVASRRAKEEYGDDMNDTKMEDAISLEDEDEHWRRSTGGQDARSEADGYRDDEDYDRWADGNEYRDGGSKDRVENTESATQIDHPPLPKPWVTAVSKTSGKTYYYNEVTQESSWDFPQAPAEPAERKDDGRSETSRDAAKRGRDGEDNQRSATARSRSGERSPEKRSRGTVEQGMSDTRRGEERNPADRTSRRSRSPATRPPPATRSDSTPRRDAPPPPSVGSSRRPPPRDAYDYDRGRPPMPPPGMHGFHSGPPFGRPYPPPGAGFGRPPPHFAGRPGVYGMGPPPRGGMDPRFAPPYSGPRPRPMSPPGRRGPDMWPPAGGDVRESASGRRGPDMWPPAGGGVEEKSLASLPPPEPSRSSVGDLRGRNAPDLYPPPGGTPRAPDRDRDRDVVRRRTPPPATPTYRRESHLDNVRTSPPRRPSGVAPPHRGSSYRDDDGYDPRLASVDPRDVVGARGGGSGGSAGRGREGERRTPSHYFTPHPAAVTPFRGGAGEVDRGVKRGREGEDRGAGRAAAVEYFGRDEKRRRDLR
ncbi:hypothetical protein HDV00_001742 [Rhizophlyctis rosea]|nr:hypothetical protein HDV00_001742 [Rhizophlyctis rosea]